MCLFALLIEGETRCPHPGRRYCMPPAFIFQTKQYRWVSTFPFPRNAKIKCFNILHKTKSKISYFHFAINWCPFLNCQTECLVDHCKMVADAAPSLPFYYYHLPAMTGVERKCQGCVHDRSCYVGIRSWTES